MSAILPPRIEPGKELRQFLEELLQYLKSITPQSSDTIAVNHTVDGCILTVIDKNHNVQGAGLLESVGGTVIDKKEEDEEDGGIDDAL